MCMLCGYMCYSLEIREQLSSQLLFSTFMWVLESKLRLTGMYHKHFSQPSVTPFLGNPTSSDICCGHKCICKPNTHNI